MRCFTHACGVLTYNRSRVRWFFALVVMGGCGFEASLPSNAPRDGQLDDAPTSDGPPPVDAAIDAPPGPQCVRLACELVGGTCANGVCVIDNDTQTAVVCPGGMPCRVICDTTDACKAGGVDCGMATSCEVRCIGTATCQSGGVDCGSAATCEVRCEGNAACQTGPSADKSVECRASTCDVTCTGPSACQEGIDVDNMGSCTSHCCDGACEGGFDTCTNDDVCT